jgi:hypothetical protein
LSGNSNAPRRFVNIHDTPGDDGRVGEDDDPDPVARRKRAFVYALAQVCLCARAVLSRKHGSVTAQSANTTQPRRKRDYFYADNDAFDALISAVKSAAIGTARARPQQQQQASAGVDVLDSLERGVIAVLIKHLGLVSVTHTYWQSLSATNASAASTPSSPAVTPPAPTASASTTTAHTPPPPPPARLVDVARMAQRFKLWLMQRLQVCCECVYVRAIALPDTDLVQELAGSGADFDDGLHKSTSSSTPATPLTSSTSASVTPPTGAELSAALAQELVAVRTLAYVCAERI